MWPRRRRRRKCWFFSFSFLLRPSLKDERRKKEKKRKEGEEETKYYFVFFPFLSNFEHLWCSNFNYSIVESDFLSTATATMKMMMAMMMISGKSEFNFEINYENSCKTLEEKKCWRRTLAELRWVGCARDNYATSWGNKAGSLFERDLINLEDKACCLISDLALLDLTWLERSSVWLSLNTLSFHAH